MIANMSIGCGDSVNCRDTDTAMWQSGLFKASDNLSRWTISELPPVAVEADTRAAHRPQYIAMSRRRLFLDGLLPSRARLRFTGGADDTAPHRRVNFVIAEVSEELSIPLTASDRTVEEFGQQFR